MRRVFFVVVFSVGIFRQAWAMSLSFDEFVKQLESSGLVSPRRLSEFLARPESSAKDVQTLAKELIRRGLLTKFQANAAYNGRLKKLILGEYVLLDRLGEGGMGIVYKARHRRMDRIVALKTLPAAALKRPELVERFYREVRAAARLSHPNIVTAYDAGEQDGTHYLVMEYVEGDDLAALVRRLGVLPVAQAVECIIQAAAGLEYAHQQSVVHRDLKPSNLILARPVVARSGSRETSDGASSAKDGSLTTSATQSQATVSCVKVLDMGLARLADDCSNPLVSTEAPQLTESGQLMGTIDFMSPEQAEDTRRADQRSDIYSLGCTLYWLLTGEAPYGVGAAVNKLLAHRERAIPSLRAARGDVPEELDRVFQKMVAKRPGDRQPSMSAVIAELRSLATESVAAASQGMAAGNKPADLSAFSQKGVVTVAYGPQGPQGYQVAATVTLAPTQDRALKVDRALRDRSSSHGVTRLLSRPQFFVAAAVVVIVVLAGIIITFKHKDGSVTAIKAPDGATVEITDDGGARGSRATSPNSTTDARGPRAPQDAYRRVAEAVLQAGGTLDLIVGPGPGDRVTVSKLGDLPDRPFVFSAIDLTDRRDWTDQQQQLLHDVQWVGTLRLNGTSITDAGMEPISELAGYELALTSTAITDAGIERLGPNSGWSVTYLSQMKLTDRACEQFASMKRLSRLTVMGAEITDVGFRRLAKNSALQWLEPTVSMTADGLNALSELPHLRTLHLADRTDPAVLNLFTGVERIPSLRVVFLPPSVDADSAKRLQMARPDLIVAHPDVPVPEVEQAALQWVLDQGGSVSGNKSPGFGFGPIVAADLQRPAAIHQIKLDHLAAPQSGVEHLRGLRHVGNIVWPQLRLDDPTTEQLASFVTLRNVDADARSLTATGLERLTSLADLSLLSLPNAPALADDDWAAVARVPFLRTLNVYNSSLRDGALAHIGQCPNLESLDLSGCRSVTHAGLGHLASLPWLWTLDLRGNPQLDDRAVEPLRLLQTLRVLCLSGTNVTPEGISRLSHALPNCAIFHDGGVALPDTE